MYKCVFTHLYTKAVLPRDIWWEKNNTWDSNVVPHRSTNQARQCLTSLSRREAVLSLLYGRSCFLNPAIFCHNLPFAAALYFKPTQPKKAMRKPGTHTTCSTTHKSINLLGTFYGCVTVRNGVNYGIKICSSGALWLCRAKMVHLSYIFLCHNLHHFWQSHNHKKCQAD